MAETTAHDALIRSLCDDDEPHRSLRGTPLPPPPPAHLLKKHGLRSFPPHRIRNVSVVAHVDHGKTTLTDALLRTARLLPSQGSTSTFTDRLRVEKERGITVKAQTCSIFVTRPRAAQSTAAAAKESEDEATRRPDAPGSTHEDDEDEVYLINLIDTPGHVDFQYEVSRSLRASEGVMLLVDVMQGVQAQTMAQFHAALENDCAMVPVLTKLDAVLHEDQVSRTLSQLEDSTGLLREEVVRTSAMRRRGVQALLSALIDRVPPPQGRVGWSDMSQLPVMYPDGPERRAAEGALVPFRALLFDGWTVSSGGIDDVVAAAAQSHPCADPCHTSSHRTAARRPLHSDANITSASAAAGGTGGGIGERGSVTIATQVRDSDGVYCLIRVMDGTVEAGTTVTFFHSRRAYVVEQVGIIHPTLYPTAALTVGMVGYLFIRHLHRADVHMGDTICTLPTRQHTLARKEETAAPGEGEPVSARERVGTAASLCVHPVPGFKRVQPVVFADFYPNEGVMITSLRTAVDLLCINDPAVTVESLVCPALGPGLQLGFLGLLHMQVFQERLLGEFGHAVLVTPPQVRYVYVRAKDMHAASSPATHEALTVHNWRWPHEGVGAYLEPMVHATVITPKAHFAVINTAALTRFRATQEEVRVVTGDEAQVLARYRMPLAELARGFFTLVKSSSHGYATLSYDEAVYEEADLVKVDVVVNKARLSALSMICARHEAASQARRVLQVLKEHLPRSVIDLPLQALIANKIIARETIKAYSKDVTAKIHAGDLSRKQKKWNDQKKGKERIARRSFGTVTLDQTVLAASMGASTIR